MIPTIFFLKILRVCHLSHYIAIIFPLYHPQRWKTSSFDDSQMVQCEAPQWC
jgi:hypothetical protein